MSLLICNDIPVARAEISIPRVGRAVLDALLASESGPGPDEAAKLKWQDGTTMTFTCLAAGKASGWHRIRAVSGKNKLDRLIPSRYYEGIPISTVALDIIREAGEEPGSIDLPGFFQRYTRRAGPAWHALVALLEGFDRMWRVKFDGRVWVGKDDPKSTESIKIFDGYPGERRYRIELSPSLEPGQAFRGILDGEESELGAIERIRHVVGPKLYTEVYCGG